MKIRLVYRVLTSFALGVTAVQAQQTRPPDTSVSTLPRRQQAAINAAINRWDRQFKWAAQGGPDDSIGESSFATIRLGPPGEKDLVIADQSGCSPTGNCTMFFLRPVGSGYRVVLDGIGQTYTLQCSKTHGFHDIQLRMHGSAFMSAVKIYKFSGSRYLRSVCYNETFETLDKDGNPQELDKPQVTPCR